MRRHRRGALGIVCLGAAVLSVALLSVAGLVGCGSDGMIAPERYSGPALVAQPLDRQHLLVATTPGSGWEVEIDQTRKTADNTEVYVTLRRPNPAAAYAAGPVEQRVLTRVPADQPLGILARVLDYGTTEGRAYRRVR